MFKLSLNFFATGKLLKQVNAIALILIPKNEAPCTINEHMSLACCNVILKVITKILANRLSVSLPLVVSSNQRAFVTDRSMAHNISLCQELMLKYGRKGISPRCTIKVDIQKGL